MEFSFAPLEGIGGYVYRNAQAACFAPADRYFSPFLSPGADGRLTPRDRRQVDPVNNQGISLIPQVLTNHADAFLVICRNLVELGYEEVNLNLGCPSRTVVTKGRGAGFLGRTQELEAFLDRVFSADHPAVSIKTRIGMENPDEFARLLEIYNRYPLKELIVHPRLQTDYYKNQPNWEVFAHALAHSSHPVIYNGDLFTCSDFHRFREAFPQVDSVMLGRGILANPALFRQLQGGAPLDKDSLKVFLHRLIADYQSAYSGETNVLYRLKELWFYLGHSFTNPAKYVKQIKKAQRLADYREAERKLFAEQEICESTFRG